MSSPNEKNESGDSSPDESSSNVVRLDPQSDRGTTFFDKPHRRPDPPLTPPPVEPSEPGSKMKSDSDLPPKAPPVEPATKPEVALGDPSSWPKPPEKDAGAPEGDTGVSGLRTRPRPQRQSARNNSANVLPENLRRGAQIGAAGKIDDLLEVDIANRRGNYMFTIGKPGVGKSTLQMHLVRYLDQHGDYSFDMIEPDEPGSAQAAKMRQLLVEWRAAWRSNTFPESTEKGRPSEFRYRVKPRNRNDGEINFGFFEISGENFEQFRRGLDAEPNILKSLHTFLANEQCKFLFIFVCIGHDVDGDDELFSDFLDYLRSNFGDRYLKKSRVAIVISDPEEAATNLKIKRREVGQSGDLDAYLFVQTFLKGTYRRLKDWKHDFGLTQFDVGAIKVDETNSEFIEDPSFEDAKNLFDWMYEAFTGVDPRPSPGWLERINKFLKRL